MVASLSFAELGTKLGQPQDLKLPRKGNHFKNEDNLKIEDDPRNGNNLRNKDKLKN